MTTSPEMGERSKPTTEPNGSDTESNASDTEPNVREGETPSTDERTATSETSSTDGPPAPTETMEVDPPVEAQIEALDGRLTAVEAEIDAVRGLLGGVETVDERVEKRASIALAKVESLERQLAPADDGLVRERFAEARRPDSSTVADDSDVQDPLDGDARSPPDGDTQSPLDGDSRSPRPGGAFDFDADDPDAGLPDGDDESLATRLRDAFR
ncbi:DUF7310 family coiled-coil domain-containing protein [Halobellus captivus]|uniref:DUF7310 family coiled-coil domain-containing protein n=1 Tax=Halobellus captivus TaxID=2592614 RepID=UPI0011A20DE7|nr:hypothetical protein [Halobellus captivus]